MNTPYEDAKLAPQSRFVDPETVLMHDAHQTLRTIRLSDRQRERLLSALEKQSTCSPETDRRDLRLRYNRGACEATLSSGGSIEMRHVLTPRNLSRRGFGFIHGQFVHRGTRCCIELVDLDDHPCRVRGSVARCQHLSGIIHEVSVVFDDPIELESFVELDADQHRQLSREIKRKRLNDSTLALLDSSPRRRDALKQSLRAHVGRVHAAEHVAGLLQILERYDCQTLLLVAEPVRDPTVCEMLRSAGYEGHIIWLEQHDAEAQHEEPSKATDEAEDETETQTEAEAEADPRVHRLRGEITADQVLAKLHEVFTAEDRSGGDAHAFDADPLRAAVIEGIRGRAEVLREAARAGDAPRLSQLCAMIADTAAAVDLFALADTAHAITGSSIAAPPPADLPAAVERLLHELGESRTEAA
ncbi:MAG: hypothetical protein ACOC1G_06370 [Phycisphaeraceae bacterium]